MHYNIVLTNKNMSKIIQVKQISTNQTHSKLIRGMITKKLIRYLYKIGLIELAQTTYMTISNFLAKLKIQGLISIPVKDL